MAMFMARHQANRVPSRRRPVTASPTGVVLCDRVGLAAILVVPLALEASVRSGAARSPLDRQRLCCPGFGRISDNRPDIGQNPDSAFPEGWPGTGAAGRVVAARRPRGRQRGPGLAAVSSGILVA
jgi:hypothetical protein